MSRWLMLMLATAVAATGLSLAVWSNREAWGLPEKVPTHWGLSGEPDKYTARDDMFWPLMLVPLMMFGFVGLAALIPWLSPRNVSIPHVIASCDLTTDSGVKQSTGTSDR